MYNVIKPFFSGVYPGVGTKFHRGRGHPAGCSPRPRSVWHKLYNDATHLGDDAARVVIGFAEPYIIFQYVFLIALECYFDDDCAVFTLFHYYFDAVALLFFVVGLCM